MKLELSNMCLNRMKCKSFWIRLFVLECKHCCVFLYSIFVLNVSTKMTFGPIQSWVMHVVNANASIRIIMCLYLYRPQLIIKMINNI